MTFLITYKMILQGCKWSEIHTYYAYFYLWTSEVKSLTTLDVLTKN